MIDFTAYVWCYNEESRLPITLESLKDFKNVIIIDKSSTDRSVEIAKEYNRKVFKIDYFDSYDQPEAVESIKKIWDSCPTEWLFQVTCSDVYHPMLYSEMMKAINERSDLDAIYVPLYRYSMGYVSKNSFFGEITYQPKLFKKTAYDWSMTNIHGNYLHNAKNVFYLKPTNRKIAIYHLTHENLELVMERHLRYAKTEAESDKLGMQRHDYLKKSWRKVWGVVYRYFKLGTFKLGVDGKAQFCMLMLYRCANYLDLYFSQEKEREIKGIYDEIRKGNFDC